METETLRALIDRLNGLYRAALSSAYCPSSEQHRATLAKIRETNETIDMYMDTIDRVSGQAPNVM